MKKSITILLFTLLLSQALGQPYVSNLNISGINQFSTKYNELFLFVMSDSPMYIDEKILTFEQLVEKSKQKYHQDTIYWIEKVYYMIQRKQLRMYENYVNFNNTLTDHKYDCVTGTALVSLVLSRLNIPHYIIEFPYHVTISLLINDQKIMIESTDPIYGFVKNQQEYKERMEFYLFSDEFPEPFMEIITIEQLAGLHYYNLAFALFEEEAYQGAFKMVSKAEELYPSGRIQSLKFQIITEMSHPVVKNN